MFCFTKFIAPHLHKCEDDVSDGSPISKLPLHGYFIFGFVLHFSVRIYVNTPSYRVYESRDLVIIFDELNKKK